MMRLKSIKCTMSYRLQNNWSIYSGVIGCYVALIMEQILNVDLAKKRFSYHFQQ